MRGDRGPYDPLFGPELDPDRALVAPANWSRRLAARLVDSLIMVLPGVLVLEVLVRGVLGLTTSDSHALDGEAPTASEAAEALPGDMMLAFLVFALWVGYETFFLSRWGQTPGKILLGIRVVAIDQGAALTPVPAATAATRAGLLNLVTAVTWAPEPILTALLVLTLLAMAWPLWDRPKRQGLHDKLVQTMVVRVVSIPPGSSTG